MPKHILKSFDEELQQLRVDLIQMGNAVARAVDQSVTGLLEGRREICADVVDDDDLIDEQQKQLDSRGMAFLLRYNPVASDFRMAVSTLSICRHLERIGDHAVNIAKSARKILKSAGTIPESQDLEPLFEAARNSLSEALVAYSDGDEERALRVIHGDEIVDRLHKKLSRDLTSRVADPPQNAENILQLLFISRALERMGDLSANIAEDIIFIASAEDVRHTF